jgi:hypothetical protein
MYATCFGVYLVRLQACQHKNIYAYNLCTLDEVYVVVIT